MANPSSYTSALSDNHERRPHERPSISSHRAADRLRLQRPQLAEPDVFVSRRVDNSCHHVYVDGQCINVDIDDLGDESNTTSNVHRRRL